MIAAITGIGWVTTTSMGCGRDHKILTPEDGKLPKLTSRMIFGRTSSRFGRLDTYSKLGFAAITFALSEANRVEWHEKRAIGIVASTVHGCLATDIKYYETAIPHGGALASPNLFAYTLPNVFLGEVAIRFGLGGPSFVVHESTLSGIAGLRMALTSLALDECSVMLAGTCDAGCPERFPCEAEVPPGALFFVLEKTLADGVSSYGALIMNKQGEISFGGMQVQNLEALAWKCLQPA